MVFSIIWMVLSPVLVTALYLIITNLYFNKLLGSDAQTGKTLVKQCLEAVTNPAEIIQKAKDISEKANKTIKKQEEEMQKLFEQH